MAIALISRVLTEAAIEGKSDWLSGLLLIWEVELMETPLIVDLAYRIVELLLIWEVELTETL